jgi:signal peptidase II
MTNEMKKPLLALILLFVVSVGLDQGTKQWAYHALLDEGFHAETDKFPVCGDDDQERARARFVRRHQENITVIDGLFELRYVENCASAFGMMGGAPEWFRFPFFIVVSIFAAFFIPYLYRKTPPTQRLMLYAMPFVLGGAVGNLLDRLIFRYVIDFVDWYVVVGGVGRHWPTFNIADAAIVIGIGLMALQILRPGKKKQPEAAAP